MSILKTAQKRSLLNRARENVNIPGAYLEGFFRPELDRVMKHLKGVDDRVRAELSGETIGEAAPSLPGSAKELLKSCRTNFARREYMAAIIDLGMFHKKMFDVRNELQKYNVEVNKIHDRFLFDGMGSEDKKKQRNDQIEQLRQHMSQYNKKAQSEYYDQLVKEAGVMDFFHNIGSRRGRALMTWERKYPQKTKELRDVGLSVLDRAQSLLDNTLVNLKVMATARAVRRPDEYKEAGDKIVKDYSKFDEAFNSYYTKVVMPLLQLKDEIEKQEALENPPASENGSSTSSGGGSVPDLEPNTERSGVPNFEEDNAPINLVQKPQSVVTKSYPVVPLPVQQTEEEAPSTLRGTGVGVAQQSAAGNPKLEVAPAKVPADDAVKNMTRLPMNMPLTRKKPAHDNFYQALEKMSQESPTIIAGFISRYAASIVSSDPSTSSKLVKIAQNIRLGV